MIDYKEYIAYGDTCSFSQGILLCIHLQLVSYMSDCMSIYILLVKQYFNVMLQGDTLCQVTHWKTFPLHFLPLVTSLLPTLGMLAVLLYTEESHALIRLLIGYIQSMGTSTLNCTMINNYNLFR